MGHRCGVEREGRPIVGRHARLAVAGLLSSVAAASALAQQPAEQTAEEPGEPDDGFFDRFRDPEDGKFDVTANSEGGSGFLPIAIPFNEPAVGAGLLGAALYFHPTDEEAITVENAPPTITFGALGVSDNDSWIAAGGHAATLRGGRVRYLGVLGRASLNLDFYGIGGGIEVGNPLGFNLAGNVLVQQAQFQLGDSHFASGFRYTLLAADVQFDVPVALDLATGDTTDAGLAAFVNYDTRDNVFTPNRGAYAQMELARFSESLGGDFDYWRSELLWYKFWSLRNDRLTFGLRTEYASASSSAPFYSLPWVALRGVPALRYLGNHAVTVEIEPRFEIDSRWSVVGFTGLGRASKDLDSLEDADAAYNYGFGFRYLLSRQQGLAAGIDLAYGPEESILTFTVGNAWAL